MCDLVALSALAPNLLDPPVPPSDWASELEARGYAVIEDDIGLLSVSRDTARLLMEEHRAQQEAVARKREAIERRQIEADRLFRESLPRGLRADEIPPGVPAGMLMCAADPMGQESQRESMVAHALRGGGIVFHPIGGEQADQ